MPARQRPQPRAGRLDLLLSDPETLTRYEVEIQLRALDVAGVLTISATTVIDRTQILSPFDP